LDNDTVLEANTDEAVNLKRENKDLKQAVAELYLRDDWLKKKPDWAVCGLGRRLMYTASEKLAIIRLAEESELSVRRTLCEVKVSRTASTAGTVLMSATAWKASRTRAELPVGIGIVFRTLFGHLLHLSVPYCSAFLVYIRMLGDRSSIL
jgi:hypothetical protein